MLRGRGKEVGKFLESEADAEERKSSRTSGDSPLNGLLRKAAQSWLSVDELIPLLTPETTLLPLSTKVSETPPTSGSIFLFDRKKVRRFRIDGHKWIMKKNINEVQESQVLLRVQGQFRVMGCYAYSVDSTLSRRSYYLVHAPTSSTRTSGSKKLERDNDLILVHYLDKPEIGGGRPKAGRAPLQSSSQSQQSTRRKRGAEASGVNSPSAVQTDLMPENTPVRSPATKLSIDTVQHTDETMNRHVSEGGDLEALVEHLATTDEGGYSAIVERLTDPLLATTSAYRGRTQILEDDAAELAPRPLLPGVVQFTPSSSSTTEEEAADLAPRPLLPSVVRFTPSSSSLTSGNEQGGDFYVTTSSPVAEVGEVVDSTSTNDQWQRYVSFVSLSRGTPNNCANGDDGFISSCLHRFTVRDAINVPIEQCQGSTYRCKVPRTTKSGGHVAVCLVAVRHNRLVECVAREAIVTQRVVDAMQSTLNDASLGMSDGVRPTFFETENVSSADARLLTQLSVESFCFAPAQQIVSTVSLSPERGSPTGTVDAVPSGETISSWMTGPQLVDRDERSTVTLGEISAAIEDISGGSTSPPNLAQPTLSDRDLFLLDLAIDQLPLNEKAEAMQAQLLCPDLVGRDAKSLFLLSSKGKGYAAVASQFCKYWKFRVEVFGADNAFLPMNLKGALKDDNSLAGLRRIVEFLPGVEDCFGRSLMMMKLGHTSETVTNLAPLMRAIFFAFHAAAFFSRNPANGVVVLVDMTDLDRPEATNRHATNGFYRIAEAMPINLRAMHYINPPWFLNLIYPVINALSGREMRHRKQFHRGSHEEVGRKLAHYGILKHHIPKESGGTFEFDRLKWLEDLDGKRTYCKRMKSH